MAAGLKLVRGLSPTLAAFRASDMPVRAAIGPVAGGRKFAAVQDILWSGYQGKRARWRWIAVNATLDELHEHTIKAWHLAVPPAAKAGDPNGLGIWDPVRLRHDFRQELPRQDGGAWSLEMIFLAWSEAAHRRRLLSIAGSGFWLDNARDLPLEVVERARGAEPWPEDSNAGVLVIASSRMPVADHWLATHRDVTLFRQPGGRAPNAEAAHLKGGRAYYQRRALGRSEEWVRVHIDAEFKPVALDHEAAAEARDKIKARLLRLRQAELMERSAA